jgi:hypothetical protein
LNPPDLNFVLTNKFIFRVARKLIEQDGHITMLILTFIGTIALCCSFRSRFSRLATLFKIGSNLRVKRYVISNSNWDCKLFS